MSNKFVYYDKSTNMLKFSDLALGIKAFRILHDRDKSEAKEKALSELTFCYFVTSMSKDNPYRNEPAEKRIDRVIEDLYEGENILIEDKDLHNAVTQMKKYNTSIEKNLLNTSLKGAEKLRKFIDDTDLNEVDANRRLVHDAVKYKKILDELLNTVKTLKEVKQMVDDGEEEGSSLRGGLRPEFDLG